MSKSNKGSVARFAVGSVDGSLWTGKGTCDVYVAARTLGGDLKVSLHESGVWRLAFTEQYWEGRAATGDENRVIERWNRPPAIEGSRRRSWRPLRTSP